MKKTILIFMLVVITTSIYSNTGRTIQKCYNPKDTLDEELFKVFTVPKNSKIRMYNLDQSGYPYGSMYNLKKDLPISDVLFITNGGMFTDIYSPLGLYIDIPGI